MKVREIHSEQEFYQAVSDFIYNVYRWDAYTNDDCKNEPTPDEALKILEDRIQWIKEHKRVVNNYLRKRKGGTWARIIDGSRADAAD